jgi:lycopene cyclase domain-containing protein
MTYTALAVIGVLAAVVVDRWAARTRLTSTRTWWVTYGIIVFFQLLTNGWLTGRGIVRYDPDTILGVRLLYAPVEDLAFGFGLVLTSCVVWVWLGRRSEEPA